MTKLFSVLLMATLATPAAAFADPAKTVVLDESVRHKKAALVQAAEEVCQVARAHDLFDDFGTQDECVRNTVAQARQARLDRDRHPLVLSRAQ